MPLPVTIAAAALVGAVIGAFVTWLAGRGRLLRLEHLRTFVASLGSQDLSLRLPPALDAMLGTGLNNTLQILQSRLEIAERRGFEWEKAVDSVEQVVCVLDSSGYIIRANRACARALGVDVRQIRGLRFDALIGNTPSSKNPIDEVLNKRRAAVGVVGPCPLGTRVRVVAAPVERGSDLMVFAIAQDVSAEVHESERRGRFERFVLDLPMSVAIADPASGRITFSNPAFDQMLGGFQDPASPRVIDEMLSSPTEEERAKLRRCDQESVLVDLRRLDGTVFPSRVRRLVQRRPSGAVDAAMYLFEDVSTERAVHGERELLAAAVDGTKDGVMLMTREGLVTYANRAAGEMYGRPPKKLLGLDFRTCHLDAIDGAGTKVQIWDALHAGRSWSGDLLRICADGACLLTRATLSVVDVSDHPDAVVAILHDLTAERDFQEELLRNQKLATLGELAASIGHEISNPLTFVIESARWLCEDLSELQVSDTIKQTAGDCLDSAKRMQAILAEVRTFAHMGNSGARKTTFEAAISSALVLGGPAVSRHADVVRPTESGPAILADPGHLSQVVLNIVKNAAEALREQGRRGTIRFEHGIEGGRAFLKIIDDGPGIPKPVLARLFRDFVTTKERGRGTGFGLRLSSKLIAESGGSIDVASEPGHGATFTLSLPLDTGAAPVVLELPQERSRAAHGPSRHEGWGSDLTMPDVDPHGIVTAAVRAVVSRTSAEPAGNDTTIPKIESTIFEAIMGKAS